MLFVIRKRKKEGELEAFYIENEPEKLSQVQNLKAERIFRLIMDAENCENCFNF